MKKMNTILLLSTLSLSAVEIRQDYFPLAVGNEWHYNNCDPDGDQLLTHSFIVTGIQDSSFTITERSEHPFADVIMSEIHKVSLEDNGIITGFRWGEAVHRNYYFSDDQFVYSQVPESFIYHTMFSLDRIDITDTVYTDVWGIDPISSSSHQGEIYAQGIGMLGFDMDFSTKEFPNVGHRGFQLDYAVIVPTPSVTQAEWIETASFLPMDSSFSVSATSDSALELTYSLTSGMYENSVVSSSYDEVTNTLRIWLTDQYFIDDVIVMDMSVVAAIIKQDQLVEKLNMNLPGILGHEMVSTPSWNIPQQVPTQCSFVKLSESWLVTASGGVDVDSFAVAEKTETVPSLGKLAVLASKRSADNWWWNAN